MDDIFIAFNSVLWYYILVILGDYTYNNIYGLKDTLFNSLLNCFCWGWSMGKKHLPKKQLIEHWQIIAAGLILWDFH